jgi:branched-chain amino acid transport system ATP-binding protein
MTVALELDAVEAGYGPVAAIRCISVKAEPRRITALLGANGAGKTSTMLAISGLLAARSGDIRLDGASVATLRNDERVRRGIVQVPQGRQLFPRMTVRENIEMGAFLRRGPQVAADLERVLSYFPAIASRLAQTAGTLSGGEQQMVAIGRALMARPRVLLLDEPSLGLAPVVVDGVYEIVRRLRDDGLTILLAEQNVKMALAVASNVFVLQNGKVSASGGVAEMATNDFIRKAYLG